MLPRTYTGNLPRYLEPAHKAVYYVDRQDRVLCPACASLRPDTALCAWDTAPSEGYVCDTCKEEWEGDEKGVVIF